MPPHMTHFKMRSKPGERQKVIDHFDLWLRDRRPGVGGFIRLVLCSKADDPDEFMAYAMFADKQTYDANSNSPEQNDWYEKLRSHLVADPEWFDGTVERQRMGQV
jgi:quinol monooxygenase YgiN